MVGAFVHLFVRLVPLVWLLVFVRLVWVLVRSCAISFRLDVFCIFVMRDGIFVYSGFDFVELSTFFLCVACACVCLFGFVPIVSFVLFCLFAGWFVRCLFVCSFVCIDVARLDFFGVLLCSTSPPGGNQVDGLPPV